MAVLLKLSENADRMESATSARAEHRGFLLLDNKPTIPTWHWQHLHEQKLWAAHPVSPDSGMRMREIVAATPRTRQPQARACTQAYRGG